MKVDLESLVAEAKAFKEKSIRPKYPKEFRSRVLVCLQQMSPAEVSAILRLDKSTLERWNADANRKNSEVKKNADDSLTFSPVVPQSTAPRVVQEHAENQKDIRLDITYRDGRRMVIELPSSQSATAEVLASLKQEFFRGC